MTPFERLMEIEDRISKGYWTDVDSDIPWLIDRVKKLSRAMELLAMAGSKIAKDALEDDDKSI